MSVSLCVLATISFSGIVTQETSLQTRRIFMKNGSRAGIDVLIEREESVPPWLYRDSRVQIGLVTLGSRPVRRVRISGHGVRVVFTPSDIVGVGLPDQDLRGAFDTQSVLRVRTLEGRVLKQNVLFCPKCLANSGEYLRPSNTPRRDIYSCRTCRTEWSVAETAPAAHQV